MRAVVREYRIIATASDALSERHGI